MASDLDVRLATTHDLNTLTGFAKAMATESEGVTLDPDTIHHGTLAVLNDPWKGFYLICLREGQALGSLMVTFEWSDWRNGPIWWIQSVYVAADARGQGVYDALHAEVTRRALLAGAAGLRLYVAAHNDRARRVYERIGMTGGHYVVYEQYF